MSRILSPSSELPRIGGFAIEPAFRFFPPANSGIYLIVSSSGARYAAVEHDFRELHQFDVVEGDEGRVPARGPHLAP